MCRKGPRLWNGRDTKGELKKNVFFSFLMFHPGFMFFFYCRLLISNCYEWSRFYLNTYLLLFKRKLHKFLICSFTHFLSHVINRFLYCLFMCLCFGLFRIYISQVSVAGLIGGQPFASLIMRRDLGAFTPLFPFRSWEAASSVVEGK